MMNKRIKRVEIMAAMMPKEDPKWRTAIGGGPMAQGFVVKLTTDDGLVGVGYANVVTHFGVTRGEVQAALERYTDVLIDQDPFNIEKLLGMLNRVLPKKNAAQAAIDLALHDLKSKALGVPLYALLGGLVREEVTIIRILSLKEPEEMAANARKLVEKGYSYIKVKVGDDPVKDVERVRQVRKGVGDGVHLTVDPNQSYDPKTAINVLKRMHEYGVELCEQPVPADDWQGLAAVTRAVDCLVEAHESALTLGDIFGLVKGRIVDCIHIKIDQLGGIHNAKIAAALCKLGNVSCRIGATGSRILAAASTHFVASTENVSYACELGEFSRLLNDPAVGLEVDGGKLRVPTVPGIGVSLRS